MNYQSLLSKFSRSCLNVDPYPHIVIENAIDESFAEKLREEFPSSAIVGADDSQNNMRWSYRSKNALENPQISESWHDIVDYHSSAEFWFEVRAAFGEHVARMLRSDRNQVCMRQGSRVGLRGVETFDSCDVLLEAQISGNTPVSLPTAVRSTHLDEGNKIFSGLYYLRDREDTADGGDLLIQRWKHWVPNVLKPKLYFEGMQDCIEVVRRIPYRQNTLVLFLDSIDSLHAVTTRQPTPYTRKFLNLGGFAPDAEYRVSTPNLVGRIRRKLTKTEH